MMLDHPQVRILSPMGALVGLAVLCSAGGAAAQTPGAESRQLYEDMRMFSQVLNQIRVNHPDSLDAHTLLMAAIEGMVRAADPHSYVLPALRLPPEQHKAAEKGELYPVPIAFAYLNDVPIVVSVHPGTKAANLGILPGDELILIDGSPVIAESAAELEILLSGRKGSKVRLTFLRHGSAGPAASLSLNVERERVEETSAVGAALMLDSLTGYVALTHLGHDRIAEQVHDTLNQLETRGMRRLVLDLRDNGGGLVSQASQIAGDFLPDGTLLYTAHGRSDEINDTIWVQQAPQHRTRAVPVVVLVNQGTASAAELLAGALQDHDRVLIVGYPTFGKSLLMRPFPMTDGSLIYLVVGHVRTPCGRSVQRPYRNVRVRDYYRFAGLIRDTTSLPSCLSARGRTLYGGGGIYPDVLLELHEPPPRWLQQIDEAQLLLRWVGQYLQDSTERPSLPSLAESGGNPEWRESFLAFAATEGLNLPRDLDASILDETLVRAIAWGVWGTSGWYVVNAMRDPHVELAVRQFDRAESLLRGAR